ncbi:hypothetical protein MRB53_025498 [Persea americana]|uniref:Uncharacterized protein n=1 Tax=Persea americana TaxID=3435 RepID=A0ACC2LGD7_PERAE|nr:hypothetical protein MRB53_025498 [Persea americana]|eukprot:TRINITY_DN26543_c0_g3_i1.p1 TRINITY_DN26543_c0_g3~~TRINITY_DN26543_c0_g3_i1.p1  ORF type:complete len:521 (+),score=48.01 TRINITY_DN26543_c0_g3_i1:481-2043(+)
MPFSPDTAPKPKPFLKKPLSFPDLWFHSSNSIKQRHRPPQNHHRHHHQHHHALNNIQIPSSTRFLSHSRSHSLSISSNPIEHGECEQTLTSRPDLTAILSDSLLVRILSLIPPSQLLPVSLVCKRWFFLHGRILRSLRLLDWAFLLSGRLLSRFPALTGVDLLPAFVDSPLSSEILLSHRLFSLPIEPSDLPDDSSDACECSSSFIREDLLLPSGSIDAALRLLARGCPNLRRLTLISPTELGLSAVAVGCRALEELELHRCSDLTLRAISACGNLRALRIVGSVDGIYHSTVSDIGLTILAHAGRRLVRMELSGCEGSYAGISAIGKCCNSLEELTVRDHRMDGGWIGALGFCSNLRRLRLVGCKQIDSAPGPAEHLGSLPVLEELELQRCQLRDKESMVALFMVCERVTEIRLKDCWGFDDQMFGTVGVCRRIRSLSLEGCSLLTTEGLESVLLSLEELQRLCVVSCNSVRDSEVTPALSSLFSVLKQFTWRPDSRSVLATSLAGTGMGKKGVKYFKK